MLRFGAGFFYTVDYTEDLPARYGGYTSLWNIRIRPRYRDDKGLLAHEKTHVRQFWRTPFLHWCRYKKNAAYRLTCEVDAYQVQLKSSPGNEWVYAGFISTKYNLNITRQEAYALLTE